jgi:hypothetical protein
VADPENPPDAAAPPEDTDPAPASAGEQLAMASPVGAAPGDGGSGDTTVGGSGAPTLSTPAFPTAYADPTKADATLQKALDDAIKAGPGSSWRVGIAIVALNADGSRPVAHYQGDKQYYCASMAKYATLYGVLELRKTVRAVLAELGANARKGTLLKQVAAHLDPKILAEAANITPLAGIKRVHALPTWDATFTVKDGADGTSVTVDLADDVKASVSAVFVTGGNTNPPAGKLVHALGYGYLNGALKAAGFIDAGSKTGVWLAGDYWDKGTAGKYPAYRIESANDGQVAQATTTLAFARMFTLMYDKKLVDDDNSTKMLQKLSASAPANSWFEQGIGTPADGETSKPLAVTHAKVGLGLLKTGPKVFSEASIIRYSKTGNPSRDFVVIWANQVGANQDDVAGVIEKTITAYAAPAAAPAAASPSP